MRLIVNESQYKQLLMTQKREMSGISEWADYIVDFAINKLENKHLFESILTSNKLNNKLGKFGFYKRLPIDNIILNIYSESDTEFESSCETEELYLSEENKIKNVIINIDVDTDKPLVEQLDKNKILITLSNISDWYKKQVDTINESNGNPWETDMSGEPLELNKNNNKRDVKRVQTMLELLNYDIDNDSDGEPNIDGIYDTQTANAVKEFQKSVFVDSNKWNSIVDSVTYNALYSEIEDVADENSMSVGELLLLGLYDEDIVDDPMEWDVAVVDDEIEDSDVEDIESGGALELRQEIVDKAYSRLGEPYKWGCEFDEKGGDCSGLIDWVLRSVDGIDSPYKGRETSKALKRLVKSKNKNRKTNLHKGDILVFNPKKGGTVGHVGFVYDVRGGIVDMIDSAGSTGVRILKNVFNTRLGKNRYYGAIPIVDGKYESK